MNRVDVVYVLLQDEENKRVLMVKNIGESTSYFTLPGGAVEPGETLQEAAVREAKEETGLDIELGELFSVREATFDTGNHCIFFTFKATIVSGDITILYPEEIEEVSWMDYEHAEQYMYIPANYKGLLHSGSSIPYINSGHVLQNSINK
ncbi:NUDIX hydrolase [Cytobacillus suaedae]|nr:NUDIX hydrolase [Cytobacillus suaedae]